MDYPSYMSNPPDRAQNGARLYDLNEFRANRYPEEFEELRGSIEQVGRENAEKFGPVAKFGKKKTEAQKDEEFSKKYDLET